MGTQYVSLKLHIVLFGG